MRTHKGSFCLYVNIFQREVIQEPSAGTVVETMGGHCLLAFFSVVSACFLITQNHLNRGGTATGSWALLPEPSL